MYCIPFLLSYIHTIEIPNEAIGGPQVTNPINNFHIDKTCTWLNDLQSTSLVFLDLIAKAGVRKVNYPGWDGGHGRVASQQGGTKGFFIFKVVLLQRFSKSSHLSHAFICTEPRHSYTTWLLVYHQFPGPFTARGHSDKSSFGGLGAPFYGNYWAPVTLIQ